MVAAVESAVARRIFLLSAVIAGGILGAIPGNSSGKEKLTVQDEIETTRAMTDMGTLNRAALTGSVEFSRRRSVFTSPDGKRYVVMLVTGDIKANGNWLTLLAGEATSIEAASHPRVVAKLFTTALGTDHGPPDPAELTLPGENPPHWLPDNERIVFFWSDANGVRQLVSVNVRNGKIEYLTHHTSDVIDFRLGAGGSFVFSASAYQPLSKEKLDQIRTKGFTVRNIDLIALLMGQGTNTDRLYDAEDRFLSSLSQPDIVQPVHGPALARDEFRISWAFRPEFSPDGRWLVIDSTPTEFPTGWLNYTGSDGRYLAAQMRSIGRGQTPGNLVKQLFLVDVHNGLAKPLWNAPLSCEIKSSIMLAWAPDSRSVVVGPTFLPPNEDSAAGQSGSAIVEVNTQTGAFSELPVPAGIDPHEGIAVRWASSASIEVERGRGNLCFSKSAEKWRNVLCSSPHLPQKPQPVRVELRQDIHTPPVIYAVDSRSGHERKVLELNPNLRTRFLLGDVEIVEWSDSRGGIWRGRLYHPIQETHGRQYPLVIQTHGMAGPDEYSLTGLGRPEQPGLGPGVGIYAAEPIASLGMFVLQMEDRRVDGVTGTPEELKLYMDAVESGIRHLVATGAVDSSRIGIEGFSHLTWSVEYILTHSTVPFSAAILADGYDGGYYLSMSQWMPQVQAMIGAPPFGKGLLTWLVNSPPFDADKVRVPLQMQAHERGNAGVLTQWEMFARLRILSRPAEMYLIPDIEHGTHTLQNPGQCLAAQQRAVDWWDFWLNNHEDAVPEKADQYSSWREMRGMLSASKETADEAKGLSGQP
jgi:hypothetical protein